jgi:transposase
MKAFTVTSGSKVFAFGAPVSMSCGFPKLSQFVQSTFKDVEKSKDLFLFYNKKGNYVKVLYAHNYGLCMFAKKLREGVFDLNREVVGKELTILALEKLINEVVIGGGTRKRRLNVAVPEKAQRGRAPLRPDVVIRRKVA